MKQADPGPGQPAQHLLHCPAPQHHSLQLWMVPNMGIYGTTLTNGQRKDFLAALVALHCTPVGRSFELAQFRGLLACLVSL